MYNKEGREKYMSIVICIERYDYNKFINSIMSKFNKINNKELLEKIISEFGNIVGEELIMMWNELYEDGGFCASNMCQMIYEVFNLTREEKEELSSILHNCEFVGTVSYKTIDSAYENLGLERILREDEE